MLFQKDIEPRCCYCQRGTQLDEEQILCVKKGVVSPGGSCRAFRYDPLKRVPTPPVTLNLDNLKDKVSSLKPARPPLPKQRVPVFCLRRSAAPPRRQPESPPGRRTERRGRHSGF